MRIVRFPSWTSRVRAPSPALCKVLSERWLRTGRMWRPRGRPTPESSLLPCNGGMGGMMARRAAWPPRPHRHKASGQDRVHWRGRDYYLGRSGSPESRAAYVELIRRLEAERVVEPFAKNSL